MKHARPDYQHIQDRTGRIPHDEPVFLIRGQDQHGADALEAYADLVERAGGDPDVVAKTREHAALMRQWPKKKAPDLEPTPAQ